MGQRNVKPIIIQGPAPEWSEKPKESPHERPGNADGESPGCGRHMSSRQTIGQIEREARVRPRRHQPVLSQYRTWWGHGPEVRGKGGCGLVVGRGEKIYSRLLLKPLLGGTSCWDDRPPKRGNLRGNRWVHALRVGRERINIVAERKATTHRGTKQVRLCLVRVWVAQCGRQVHPDQIKAVKG